jgi:deoxyhypusine synthase
MGIAEKGHDYFVQITDARPDTGGLSGATPSEAMTWGKVDPEQLPDTIVCYTDSTIAIPIMAAYALEVAGPRPLKRLYDQREAMMRNLLEDYRNASPPHHSEDLYGGGGGTAIGRGTPDVGH